MRSVRFDRIKGSLSCLSDCEHCKAAGGETPCEKACVHPDVPVRINDTRTVIEKSGRAVVPARFAEISLAVDFCGIRCENPFFPFVICSGERL